MIVETRRRTQNPDNSSRKQTVELQSREGKHKTRLIDKELKVAVRPQLKMVHILNRIHSIKRLQLPTPTWNNSTFMFKTHNKDLKHKGLD
jgi:hypothetical protein